MPEFTARVRCTYIENWSVEAADLDEARNLFEALDGSVAGDDAGECIDWKITNIKKER